MTPSVSRALIAAAGRAPSPDNNQPWAFRAGVDSIEVFHLRSRSVPSDVDDMFAGLALGAAIENLVIEATCHELQSAVEYAPEPFHKGDDREPVAIVRLEHGGDPDPLAAQLVNRTTNRRPYSRIPLNLRELSALTDSIAIPSCHVSWLSSGHELRQLARMVVTADRIRFESRSFHDELHAMFRFGAADAERRGDGLELSSLEIPRLAWPLLKWLRPWQRMKRLNRLGFSRLLARPSSAQIVSSGAIGLLTVDDPGALAYLEAGRSLERLWLTATQEGLSLQPVGALPLFLLRLKVLGTNAFEPRHLMQMQKLHNGFCELFPAAQIQHPVILFRVGRCGPPSGRSRRYDTNLIEIP